MNNVLYLFVASAGLAGILGAISIWSPCRLWVKAGAVGVVALYLPVAYAGLADLLSRPKPVNLEWSHRHLTEATVLGSQLQEDRGIYLWLQVDGAREPRAYVLPWSQKLAEQLHGMQREARARGTELRVRQPFSTGEDEEDPIFYASPPPALPPKQAKP